MSEPESTHLVQKRRVPSGAIQLASYSRGLKDKPVVVLVHGYPDNAEVWSVVAESLAQDFHVLSYDVRGAGKSDYPPRRHDYRLSQLVQDLEAVVQSWCPGQCFHLVGHDWGSIQGWEAVITPGLQSRILSYTSLSGPSLDYMGFWFRQRLGRPTLTHLIQLARQLVSSWYIFLFHLPVLPALTWRLGLARGWPRLLALLGEGRQRANPTQCSDGIHGIQLYRANMAARLFKPRPFATGVPVQLLVSARDPFVTPGVFVGLEQWVPRLSRQTLPAGHWALLSQPYLVARHIRDFVRRHSA